MASDTYQRAGDPRTLPREPRVLRAVTRIGELLAAAEALHEARDLRAGLQLAGDYVAWCEADNHYIACVDRVIAARAALSENNDG